MPCSAYPSKHRDTKLSILWAPPRTGKGGTGRPSKDDPSRPGSPTQPKNGKREKQLQDVGNGGSMGLRTEAITGERKKLRFLGTW